MAKRYQKYEVCVERVEPITHLIAECEKPAQKQYDEKDMMKLQKLYTWNYARSLGQLARLGV